MPKCFLHTVRGYKTGDFWSASDNDHRIHDQNVMCMRSGLVIKTAPVVRSVSASPRLQDGPAGSSRTQQPPPPPPTTLPPSSLSSSDTTSNDFSESTSLYAGGSSNNRLGSDSGGLAKAAGNRTASAGRPRSLDFMSIVTRFQFAGRDKRLSTGGSSDSDAELDKWASKFQLDIITSESARWLVGSEARSSSVKAAAERRVLRRRRHRRSQFATAAAAALRAAVSRAAAAAVAPPRFSLARREALAARMRSGLARPAPILAANSLKRKFDSASLYGRRIDDVRAQRVPLTSTEGEKDVIDLTKRTMSLTHNVTTHAVRHQFSSVVSAAAQAPVGSATSALAAFVDMLSQQQGLPGHVYVQPYNAALLADASVPATGSLTDLSGRVAAVPRSQDSAAAAVATVSASTATTSAVSALLSKMAAATNRPITMFRVIGGPPAGSQQQQSAGVVAAPRHLMAYRGPRAEQMSIIRPIRALPYSALPAASATVQSVVEGGSSAAPLRMLAQQLMHVPAAAASDACSVSVASGDILSVSPPGGEATAESTAHELAYDSSGRELHRCRLCARVFTVLSAFRSHVLTAHCRPKNQCTVCGKHFSRSWLLKGHMRTHTGERPYRCPHDGCDRAFADKSNLRSHLLIHSANGKHYVCTRCNRAFAQKRYLHKHRLEVCKI